MNNNFAGEYVLIFCSSLSGHRQNYCYVISNYFLSKGCSIVLAVGDNQNNNNFINHYLINQLKINPRVILIDLGNTTGSHEIHGRWLRTVLNLEKEYSPVLTIFPAADEIRISLDGLGKCPKRKSISRMGIFIYTNYFYKMNFSRETHILRPRRFIGWFINLIKEHYYFYSQVWGKLGLDFAFSTNPDFIRNSRRSRFYYLPEIYRAWNDDVKLYYWDINNLCNLYNSFLENHSNKTVILYYGGWAARRGYDYLMKLACDDPDSVFVSCGRYSSDDKFYFNVNEMKNYLNIQGRIFEQEIPFYPDNRFVDLLYKSCNFVVLPYKNFYGNSGTMIQATTYGKPVVVPNIGYMNSMVKKHGIGISYKENDYDDLFCKYQYIKEHYIELSSFVDSFSRMHGLSLIISHLDKRFSSVSSGLTV